MDSVYHEGEIAVQERAGVRHMAERIGRGIRDRIPEAAREFLGEQTFAVVAASDAEGRVWASPLEGGPGLLNAPDDRTLRVAARLAPGDPLYGRLADGRAAGVLAIEFATRRRMRLNGRAEEVPGGFVVRADEVFANCPKYIQTRERAAPAGGEPGDEGGRVAAIDRAGTPAGVGAGGDPSPGDAASPDDAVPGDELTPAQRERIARADTFFVASAFGDSADASHRGGLPGFVTAPDARTVVWPDYAGNNMFQTLGNIAADPRAGLLFVDFERGGILQVSGEARVDWSPERASAMAGAERVVELRVTRVVERPLGFGGWRFGDYSPFNPK